MLPGRRKLMLQRPLHKTAHCRKIPQQISAVNGFGSITSMPIGYIQPTVASDKAVYVSKCLTVRKMNDLSIEEDSYSECPVISFHAYRVVSCGDREGEIMEDMSFL